MDSLNAQIEGNLQKLKYFIQNKYFLKIQNLKLLKSKCFSQDCNNIVKNSGELNLNNKENKGQSNKRCNNQTT